MLSDMVTDLWRWLRKGRMNVERPVDAGEPAFAGMAVVYQVPMTVAAAIVEVPIAPRAEMIACEPRSTPFWTAAGVHGILSARRPCLMADVIMFEHGADRVTASGEMRPDTMPVVLPVDEPRTAFAAPETVEVRGPASATVVTAVAFPALAQRLRQVREANRPVRQVAAVKRQARDVLSKSGPPAAAAKAKPVALEPALVEDWRVPTIRSRPTLVYAA